MSTPRPSPTQYDLHIPAENIGFDVDRFDSFLRSHAVTMMHYKAIPCPIGQRDPLDIHTHGDTDDCSNGFLYIAAKKVTVFFSGNHNQPVFENAGIIDGSTVQVTIPRFYDDTEEEVVVQHFDRFFLTDIEIPSVTSEEFEANRSGINRTKYRIDLVEVLLDSHLKQYYVNVDFELQQGNIKWLPGRAPPFDAAASKGTVCAVRYRYRPFFYVDRLIHEIRVSRLENKVTGEEKLIRMPCGLLLNREWVYHDKQRNERDNDSRHMNAPRDGTFGPR